MEQDIVNLHMVSCNSFVKLFVFVISEFQCLLMNDFDWEVLEQITLPDFAWSYHLQKIYAAFVLFALCYE